MWWLVWILSAGAVEPEAVQSRLAELAEHRSQLLDKEAPPIPADAYRRAAEGKVTTGLVTVDGVAAKKAWGIGVFDVPIDAYWKVINDDITKVSYTKLDFAEILEGTRCKAPRRVFQFISVPFLTDRWWVVDIRENTGLAAATSGSMREQTWATDGDFSVSTPSAKEWAAKGMHIDSTQGSWVLVDLGNDHTLVEYYTWADPGGSVPAGFASRMAAGGVSDTLETMAQAARDGKACK